MRHAIQFLSIVGGVLAVIVGSLAWLVGALAVVPIFALAFVLSGTLYCSMEEPWRS